MVNSGDRILRRECVRSSRMRSLTEGKGKELNLGIMMRDWLKNLAWRTS